MYLAQSGNNLENNVENEDADRTTTYRVSDAVERAARDRVVAIVSSP